MGPRSYLPQELPEALGFLQTSLENVLSCDVVVCLVPHTPRTEGMLGKAELARLRPGAVFVSVSRGKVTDSAALIERLNRETLSPAWMFSTRNLSRPTARFCNFPTSSSARTSAHTAARPGSRASLH